MSWNVHIMGLSNLSISFIDKVSSPIQFIWIKSVLISLKLIRVKIFNEFKKFVLPINILIIILAILYFNFPIKLFLSIVNIVIL